MDGEVVEDDKWNRIEILFAVADCRVLWRGFSLGSPVSHHGRCAAVRRNGELVVHILQRVHFFIGPAEMVTQFMDQDVRNQILKFDIATLHPLIQHGEPV